MTFWGRASSGSCDGRRNPLGQLCPSMQCGERDDASATSVGLFSSIPREVRVVVGPVVRTGALARLVLSRRVSPRPIEASLDFHGPELT